MKLFLPAITGRYAVGVTTFVTPVHPPRDIGTAKIKEKGKEPRPALRLEEVAYTAYYPADVSSEEAKARKGVDWFIRCALPWLVILGGRTARWWIGAKRRYLRG